MSDTLNLMETTDPQIRDGEQAWRLLARFLQDDGPRSKARAKIRGMLDGNPPYNPAKLRRLGQGDRTNLNFREAEGFVSARQSSYFDLIMNADPLVTVTPARIFGTFMQEDESADQLPRPMDEYGDIIAREFQALLGEWSEFLFHTMRHQTEMLDYGVGPVLFPSVEDWRFKSIPMGDLLVPEKAPANVDEQEVIAVRSSMSVVDLFALVSSPEQTEASAELGWNTALVKKMVKESYETHYRQQESSWEMIQQAIKTNSLVEAGVGPGPLPIYYLFVREFAGSVGVYIVCNDRQEKRFLFRSEGMYDAFSQVINLFFLNIGDGSYHTVRGMGYKIFPHCEVSNRFLNGLVDSAKLASSAVINQRTGAQADALKMLRVGPYTVLPMGYEMADKPFNPNLQGLARVRELLQENMNSNVGMYRPTGQGIGAKTAREVNTIVRREAQLESTDISFYYAQWDKLYREMFRRLFDKKNLSGRALDDHNRFVRRCRLQQVPASLLKFDMWNIAATRTIGSGSPALRDLNSTHVLEIAPYLDGKGKHMAIRNRLLTLVGPTNVDRYIGGVDRREMPVVNSSLARMENGLMKMGQPATAGEGEDHLAHAMIHLEGVGEIQQAAGSPQQQDWNALATAMELFVAHLSEHLSLLSTNPAYEVETNQLGAAVKEANRVAVQLREAANEQQTAMAEEQARQNTQSLELQKARLETEAALQEKLNKEQNMAVVREEKAKHQMAINELKTQHQIEMDRIREASRGER